MRAMQRRPLHSFLALLVASLLGSIAAPASAQITVTEPWVRGTVPGQKGTGAFMQLTSAADTTLVGVASPVAKVVELHEMAHAHGVMRMRAIDRLYLPAGKRTELKPGGYHVMLMDLVQPLQEGDTVPVTLTFADRTGKKTVIEVNAPVRALTAPAPKQLPARAAKCCIAQRNMR